MLAYGLLLALLCDGDPRVTRTYPATFVSCYDGDTCDFNVHLGLAITVRQKVRFFGIDTPELRGAERTRALAVRDFVVQTLSSARRVMLRVPQRRTCVRGQRECDERGRYGRLLADVVADGQSVNTLLLQTGRAVPYP